MSPSTSVQGAALKGTAIRSTLAAIERVYGARGLQAVTASLGASTPRSIQFDTVFARLEPSWRGYYMQGTFAWSRVGPGAMHVAVRGVRGFNTGMWISCAGRTETLLRMTGARPAEVTVVDPADRECAFEALWLE